LTEHLGHEKNRVPVDPDAAGTGNIRNGHRPKTVLTDAAGEVSVQVPRDRTGTFEPVIVRKRQRRLSDWDVVAISLYAKGLTTGEISAQFAEVYGASVSKDTVSRICRISGPGGRGHAGLVLAAAAADLRGGLHRRHQSRAT